MVTAGVFSDQTVRLNRLMADMSEGTISYIVAEIILNDLITTVIIKVSAQVAFFINLQRAVIGLSG